MKFEVKTKDHNGIEVERLEIENNISVIKEKTKQWVSFVVLGTCAVFLISSAIYGVVKNDFNGLSAVWSSMQSILGIVIGHHLGSQNGKGDN